jgi:sugar phosphate isomerase/epimerase
MRLGVMSKAFSGLLLEEAADRMRACGLEALQLNLQSAGLETLPAALENSDAAAIGDVFRSRRLEVAAVSGTFNTTHPDAVVRAEAIRRFDMLASRCRALGTHVITLCTGTRDPEDLWRPHPENADPSAYRDLLDTLRQLLSSADEHDVTLAFEPETANVIDTAVKARRLIEEIGSARLRVVLDPANLFYMADLGDAQRVLDHAFRNLGPYIALAHAKDIAPGNGECRRVSPGEGVLDFRYYLKLLRASGYDGALIMHDLAESQVAECAARFQRWLAEEAECPVSCMPA